MYPDFEAAGFEAPQVKGRLLQPTMKAAALLASALLALLLLAAPRADAAATLVAGNVW